MEWVSVDDDLPLIENVLVSLNDGNVLMGMHSKVIGSNREGIWFIYWYEGYERITEDTEKRRVTHWMRLPVGMVTIDK